MGQIRTEECARIDKTLRALYPGDVEIESQKDTYSEDYIVWVTAHDVVLPIRITVGEYLDGDWIGNVQAAIAESAAQSAAGEDTGS